MCALAFSMLAAIPAGAQINISGNVSDSTTGPLLSGVVYHATSTLTVPAGQTLTAQPGAIVKFVSAATYWRIDGVLDCQGTLASPVIFTDIRDDTAGGDTNGDGGASVPAPGWWHGALFYSGSTGLITRTEVRYAGWGGYGGIDLQSSNVTLTVASSLLRNCSAAGFDFDNLTPVASISSSTVQGCGVAADNVPLTEIASFSGCTATGNSLDVMRVTNGSMSSNVTIGPLNTFGNPLVSTATITVASGTTLTLQPGLVVKLVNAATYFDLRGALVCQGTLASPVILTEFRDDTAGGDTNKDGGASVPARGWWHGLLFYDSSSGTLAHADVRYAGWGGYGGIDLQHPNVTLDVSDSVIRDCAAAGIAFDDYAPAASISRCAINSCGIAADGVLLSEVPSFVDCTASGNTGDYVRVTNGMLGADATIGPANTFGNPLVSRVTCTVASGWTLTLQPGTVIKMANAATYWDLRGTLDCQGVQGNPVVITDLRDDSVGGDTNKDGGASVPAPGWWHGVLLYSGSTGRLAHSEIRYAGWGGYGGIHLQHPSVTLDLSNSLMRNCSAAGIDFNNHAPTASVANCTIDACDTAVDGVLLTEVSSFTNNLATNCTRNYMRTTNSTMAEDASIQAENLINGALVITTNASVPAGRRLALGPGTVFKLASAGTFWRADGALDVTGTALAPVVFTELRDDVYAGDTNGDGSTSVPGKGFWDGVFVYSGADAMTIDGLLVRFAGWSGYPGITASSPVATLRNVRAELCAAEGIQADEHAGTAHGWVAYDCDLYGIYMTGGSFDLDHATVAKCFNFGIRKGASWSGLCTNSISWSNTAGNYTGFAAGQLRYSDGSPTLAGVDGNINLAPVFEGINTGELELKSSSPCIDTGDPFAPLDFDGTRSDMGAYAFNHCTPVAYCTGKTNSQGCVPAMRYSGYASVSSSEPFEISANNVINQKSGIFFYGLTGRLSTPFQGGTLCVKEPTTRTPISSSGGNPPPDDCSGVLLFDFNHWLDLNKDSRLLVTTVVNGQFWYRDPASPSTTGLSNAIEFGICP